MNLPNQKNILHVIVGKNETYKAEDAVISAYTDLNDGNVAIIDSDNAVRDTAAGDALGANETLRFVTRVGSQLIYTPWFKPKDIVSMSAKAYLGATQQISYIGYVGSGTGNIEAIDQNEYIVRVLIKGTSAQFGNKQMYKFGAYKSGNAATSAEVAIGLVDNLVFNFKREPLQQIKFQAICNAAVTAANGFKSGQEVTVVQGENFVTCETDFTYLSAGSSTLVAGDYLRIGSATDTNAAMTLTSGVYKVISLNATTLQVFLDRPVTAASGTYDDAAGTPTIEVIPAATGLAATWGIKATGIAASNFKPGVFDDQLVQFTLEPSNMGSTAVTYTTAAVKGNGTYSQIAELEWFAQGNLGKIFRVDTPPVTMHTQAVSGVTYETIAIKYKIRGGGQDSVTGTTPESYGEILLAFYVNSDCGDKIIATLTEWSAAQLGYSIAW